MVLDGTYFWIINLFLLVLVINSVYTGDRSGEHVHIKLHIPEVYKKHTHLQTIVKHHFHPPPPPTPKLKKVHHYHHHHHSHKSKSKSNSHFHFENVPAHSAAHLSHSHYEIPSYKPKKISPIYSTEYHFGGGGYKPMKSAPLKYSEESFRPSIPLYSVDEDDHVPEYGFNSDTHDDIMQEPENDYDETKTTPYYSAPLLNQHQPLHTSFQSSALVNEEDDDDGGAASQWNGLLSKKYKSNDVHLELPHGTTWPLSMPSELETYSTISHYTKPSTKKSPKFVYDSDSYELGYTNTDFAAALGSGSRGSSSAKINKKWPIPFSTRLITKQNYED